MTDSGERVGEVFGFRVWEGFGGVIRVDCEVDYLGQLEMVHLRISSED